MPPITAPRARRLTLPWISACASSISSRTMACARSVTSVRAAAMSCGLPVGSLVAKALEDESEDETARERGADLHLGTLERRLVVRDGDGLEARGLVGRGLGGAFAHSGGSSSKRRCQITAAVRC